MTMQQAAQLLGLSEADIVRETESINPEEPYLRWAPCGPAEGAREEREAANAHS